MVARLVMQLFQLIELIILIHVILSWVPVIDRHHPVSRFIDSIANPILAPFRQLLWPFTRRIGIDFSPFLALIVLDVIQRMIVPLLVF